MISLFNTTCTYKSNNKIDGAKSVEMEVPTPSPIFINSLHIFGCVKGIKECKKHVAEK